MKFQIVNLFNLTCFPHIKNDTHIQDPSYRQEHQGSPIHGTPPWDRPENCEPPLQAFLRGNR